MLRTTSSSVKFLSAFIILIVLSGVWFTSSGGGRIAVAGASVEAKPTQAPQNKARVKTIPTEAIPVVITTPKPEPKSDLPEIVSYIAYKFEPEGKDVVVQAINCFYSESGLRPNAVGQNTDTHRSKDWGVAQLNDYWHNLTEEQKTEYKANIDKAYDIYKGRGNFSAWYGKRCN